MSIKDYINKAKRDKQRAQNIDTAKKVGFGLGIGAALGGIFGVLFAPKAGKETREDISKAAKETAKKIKENADQVGEKIQKVVEEGKERIEKLKNDKDAITEPNGDED